MRGKKVNLVLIFTTIFLVVNLAECFSSSKLLNQTSFEESSNQSMIANQNTISFLDFRHTENGSNIESSISDSELSLSYFDDSAGSTISSEHEKLRCDFDFCTNFT